MSKYRYVELEVKNNEFKNDLKFLESVYSGISYVYITTETKPFRLFCKIKYVEELAENIKELLENNKDNINLINESDTNSKFIEDLISEYDKK